QRPYAIIDDDHLLCTVNRSGEQSIEVLQISSGTLRLTASPGIATPPLAVGGRCAAAVLSFPDRPAALALLDLDRDAWDTVRSSFKIRIPVDAISLARRDSWASEGHGVPGYFYPPVNTDWQAPEGTLPPMITLIHGGPTGFAAPEFKIGYQFWTSRGFGILDVNYSGSWGFGREYRDRLKGRWGVVDVQDCISGTLAMGTERLADPARLAIRGGRPLGLTAFGPLTMSEVF